MSKTWRVARYHFQQETGKRSFLIVLFSLPLFLIVSVGLGYLTTRLEQGGTVLGYVDQAGLLINTQLEPDADVELASFETPEAARAALEAEQIDAYYVLAPDYAQTRQAELVYYEPPDYKALRHFDNLVRLNLLADQPPALAERILSGAEITMLTTKAKREIPASGPNAGMFVPIVVAIIFAFMVLTMSGYMMQAIVEEKENRTMEIMMSSVSPAQMMAGKIAGGLAIVVLQVVVWLVFLLLVVWVGRGPLGIEWLHDIDPNWRDLLWTVLVAAPSYLFLAATMTMLGSTLVDSQEAQQAGAFFFIPLFLPFYLMLPLLENLNGALAMVLSYLPLTSVSTLALRSIFVEIPVWQYLLSAGISLGSAILMIWLSGKVFRTSMLRYGKRLNLREIFIGRQAASEPVTGRS